MDESTVRERAASVCEAIVAGDVDRVIGELSKELRQNPGEIVSMLPLPATSATIESVETGNSGFVVVLRLVGETDEVLIQTRWKDRDDRPTIVEASHLSRTELATPGADGEGVGEGGDGDAAGAGAG